LFSNDWAGGSDSACDKSCAAANGKVCGTFDKVCCKVDCDSPHWWSGQDCSDPDNVITLDCSIIQSLTGSYWSGDSCDDSCAALNGKVCGTTFKQCCTDGCDVGTVTTTCLNSNQIETGLQCKWW